MGILAASLGVRAAISAEPSSSAAILQELRSFDNLGSVLYVAAHPDDENTLLIAYLSRGRRYRTAYLSLTRGDGGQNVLGPEFGAELGLLRTEELLAARRIDGGRQFFTRAMDFGYSKSAEETLRIWDRQQVLSDIVRVIREFRPDVVITRFSPQGGGHGHHTASAILAVEAFKLAGDPKAFPDQLTGKDALSPWQPKRILQNGGGFGRGGRGSSEGAIQMDVSGNDPVTGESFASIAARSRAMHKTQGFDNFRGFGGGAGPRMESFTLLAGAPATNDIMDGVDTTWSRVPGGEEVGRLADDAISQFKPDAPATSVPALLKLYERLTALKTTDPVVAEKRVQLDRILQACLGLDIKTAVSNAEVVPGEALQLRLTATVGADVPVRWTAVRFPNAKEGPADQKARATDLRRGQTAAQDWVQTLPISTPLSQPYWLREAPTAGMYRVDDQTLIGRPENPPVFPVEYVFEVGGQTLVISDEPVQAGNEAASDTLPSKLRAIAPVALKFASDVRLFAPGTAKPLEVDVTAFRANSAGTLRLEAPAGWKVAPESQPFRLSSVGEQAKLVFTVTAPPQATSATITAGTEVGGVLCRNEHFEIGYSHIPRQLLQPLASVKAVALELATRGHSVGYVPGAGDSVADALKEMGYAVTTLDDADLTTNRLKDFDAVVVGIRVFDTHAGFASHLPALFSYVEAGGTVVMQYNRFNGLASAPLRLNVSQERVTDETAPLTFLAPDHPALNTPNKITQADFDGWVQERGIYFPNQWDERFTPILACSDPGEAPLKGGLLVAKYGQGYFVYTGLVFFRELPAGVPGAYRLFANLISLGK